MAAKKGDVDEVLGRKHGNSGDVLRRKDEDGGDRRRLAVATVQAVATVNQFGMNWVELEVVRCCQNCVFGDADTRFRYRCRFCYRFRYRFRILALRTKYLCFDLMTMGPDIQVVVPTIYRQTFDSLLLVNTTCTMSNFEVCPNDLIFKPTNQKYILKFTSGTTVSEIGKHDIQSKPTICTPFADIISGKWKKHLLTDVIGVIDEVGYTQSMVRKKPQINFILRDLGSNTLHCTLWETYATQFFEFKQKQDYPCAPVIILLKYAKIKEEGKYPLAITNTYNVTTVHINEEIPEIIGFLNRVFYITCGMPTVLPLGKTQSTTGKSSHDWSQQSSGGHLSTADKFFSKASHLPLSEIIVLSEPTMCVTVATIDKLIPDTNGWYYKKCHKCPQMAKRDSPPYFCKAEHMTEAEIWRFRICVEVVHDGTSGRFVFWDREAGELLETSATTFRSSMVESGITDPLDYPLALDKLLGKKFAFKINWNPCFKNGYVVMYLKDKQILDRLEGTDLIIESEETFPILESIPHSEMKLESISEGVSFDLLQPQTEGEISSVPVPDPVTPLATVKRMPLDDAIKSPLQPLGEGDLSSTKVKMIAKRGKKICDLNHVFTVT
ncbi:uncharacterized protein LOC131658754 [Vicia villosa]|uniref:uncharacterized protein LOC131658754 n=1 Tax=Vicia villosa TaxID=3911 RepID=UPI00273C4735|nr:uncharacterized protein LOC131658754 [Vicia villosa]